MSVISWRTDVNTKILDSTSITVGENAWVEDSSSNGFKQRRPNSLVNSTKFQVTMDFNWLDKDSNGNSEFDRFVNWYKYRHEYGSNPFYFESISRFNINGPIIGSDGNPIMCQYKITSAPQFQKSGFCMRCTMTWEEVYAGIIQAEIPEFSVDYINAERGSIYVTYTQIPSEVPSPATHEFFYSSNITSKNISDYTKINIDRVSLSGLTAKFIVDNNTKNLPAGNYKIILGKDFSKTNYQTVVTLE